MKKLCQCCKRELEPSRFYPEEGRRDKLSVYCTACQSARNQQPERRAARNQRARDWYKANRDWHIKKVMIARARRKNEGLDPKGDPEHIVRMFVEAWLAGKWDDRNETLRSPRNVATWRKVLSEIQQEHDPKGTGTDLRSIRLREQIVIAETYARQHSRRHTK